MMGANIELWQYRLFKNQSLYLEEVFRKSVSASETLADESKDPIMVAAGKKAAVTRATGVYTFEQHLAGRPEFIRQIVELVQENILGLDSGIREVPKKFYVAYKSSQNIVCMEVKKYSVTLYLKLDPKNAGKLPPNARNVSEIGHYGTGDLGFILEKPEDVDSVKPFILEAYRSVGG
jgi:predicted transport protein